MGIKSALLLAFALTTLYVVNAEELPGWYTVNEPEVSRVKRELVDLHNGEFCVDVSEWGDVEYTPLEREKCSSTFDKVCEMKTERVCSEVTEIECDIVPFTNCIMAMNMTTYKSWKTVQKEFPKKTCTQGVSTVEHEKMMPNCKNVTKLNCVTLWKTDENGKQVWAGNEDCEPVTWRECKLEAVKVGFKVPKMECAEEKSIPWSDVEEDEKEAMTTSMTCTVDFATDCKPKVSEKCNAIEYMECNEVPTEVCEKDSIQQPNQTFLHKKKCLLPDDGSIPTSFIKAKKTENEIDGSGDSKDIEASESRRESQAQAAPQEGYGAAKPDTGYGSPRQERRLSKSLEQQAIEQRRVQTQQSQLRFRQQQQQQQVQLQQQRQARTFRGHAGQPRFQNRQGQAASAQANTRRTQNVKFNQGK